MLDGVYQRGLKKSPSNHYLAHNFFGYFCFSEIGKKNTHTNAQREETCKFSHTASIQFPVRMIMKSSKHLFIIIMFPWGEQLARNLLVTLNFSNSHFVFLLLLFKLPFLKPCASLDGSFLYFAKRLSRKAWLKITTFAILFNFSSLLKNEGRKKGERIAKIRILSHAFLLDLAIKK